MTRPAIVVRHCTVTVVRRGGWSWGPAPDRLPGQVLAALSALLTGERTGQLPDRLTGRPADQLADQLAGQLAGQLTGQLTERFAAELAADEDVEITEPVRVDLRLPLAALVGLATSAAASATTTPEPAALAGRLPGDASPPAPAGRGSLRLGYADLARLISERVDLDRLLSLLPPNTLRT